MNKNVYAESSATPSQVEALLAHIRTFRRRPKAYQALHLRFSILDRLHQQPRNRRAIATAFNSLIAPYEGKLFWTNEFDLYFVCKGCSQTKLDKAKYDAIHIVDDAPIIKNLISEGKDDEICIWV